MKFKIARSQFDILRMCFGEGKTETMEIELEPVNETACQAVRENELMGKSYRQGYESGYRHGMYEGEKIYRRSHIFDPCHVSPPCHVCHMYH